MDSQSGLQTVDAEKVRLTVIYDNYAGNKGLEPAWGFSCLVEGFAKTILFDTGGNGSILLSNMARLGIDPKDPEVLILSHEHSDHVGGLSSFLDSSDGVTVYVLESFPNSIKNRVGDRGEEMVEVLESVTICPGALSTGQMGSRTAIREQSLVLSTDRGAVVITGCAHPGIVSIVERAKELAQQEILLVVGGFHLLNTSDSKLHTIISDLKDLGVRYVAPSHCSGDRTRDLFAEEFGARYVNCSVGAVLALKELPE